MYFSCSYIHINLKLIQNSLSRILVYLAITSSFGYKLRQLCACWRSTATQCLSFTTITDLKLLHFHIACYIYFDHIRRAHASNHKCVYLYRLHIECIYWSHVRTCSLLHDLSEGHVHCDPPRLSIRQIPWNSQYTSRQLSATVSNAIDKITKRSRINILYRCLYL